MSLSQCELMRVSVTSIVSNGCAYETARDCVLIALALAVQGLSLGWSALPVNAILGSCAPCLCVGAWKPYVVDQRSHPV